MNPSDDQIARLFRAAAARAKPGVEPPFGLETRIMAAWREGRALKPDIWDRAVLVRGLILALIIMGASFLPVFNGPAGAGKAADPFSEYLADVSADEGP